MPQTVIGSFRESLFVGERMAAILATMILVTLGAAGCASQRSTPSAPSSSNESVPEPEGQSASQPLVSRQSVLAAAGGAPDGYDRNEILRIVPDPRDMRMWLLWRSDDGRYSPFLEAGATVGEDTIIPGFVARETAVLYAQRDGYAPIAIEFVPAFLADLFPHLRPLPAPGTERLLNEDEALGADVWRELEAQFGPNVTPSF